MKLCHLAIVTPHMTGLYETARDIVAAECKLGQEAYLVDPKLPRSDRGAPIGNGQVEHADVVISHSGMNQYSNCGKPVIHCLHGRPESSFRLESDAATAKKHPVYSMMDAARDDKQYKRFVTFWDECIPYWELIFGKGRIVVLPAPVDLEAWTPDGPNGYGFHGKKGDINVVITDMWRHDKTPYHCLHAFVEFAKSHPGSKLHLYGVSKNKALDVILKRLEGVGILGEVVGMVRGLANVYRAATMLISPHRIATRAIREALACGCPVVHHGETDIGSAHADVEDLKDFADSMSLALSATRSSARHIAEQKYDSLKTAECMVKACEEVLNDGES